MPILNYHPARQYPKKLTYYALMGLFQTALREQLNVNDP